MYTKHADASCLLLILRRVCNCAALVQSNVHRMAMICRSELSHCNCSFSMHQTSSPNHSFLQQITCSCIMKLVYVAGCLTSHDTLQYHIQRHHSGQITAFKLHHICKRITSQAGFRLPIWNNHSCLALFAATVWCCYGKTDLPDLPSAAAMLTRYLANGYLQDTHAAHDANTTSSSPQTSVHTGIRQHAFAALLCHPCVVQCNDVTELSFFFLPASASFGSVPWGCTCHATCCLLCRICSIGRRIEACNIYSAVKISGRPSHSATLRLRNIEGLQPRMKG